MSAAASMSDVYQTLFGSGNIGRHKGCFVFALLRDEKEGLVRKVHVHSATPHARREGQRP